MEDKDREIWVGKNRIYLGPDNILRITGVGELDEETMSMMYDAFLKFATMVEGKVEVIVDLNGTGKMSTGARKAAAKMADDEKIGKIAFFGLHPVARVIASFLWELPKKRICVFSGQRQSLLPGLRSDICTI